VDADSLLWLDALPPALVAHRAVLRRLLIAVERDPRWRFLALSCSVARGAGDVDSDLDLALGAADNAWPGALDDIPALLTALGAVVDLLSHQLPEWGDRPHRRVFVQYAGGVQIDLVAYPATLSRGRPPDTVVLNDPDGRLAEPWTPSALRADAATVREWMFLGWVRWPIWRSTCGAARSGRRWSGCIKRVHTSGACGPSPRASTTPPSDSPGCSTTLTPRCRRASTQRSPPWTLPICVARP